MNFKKTWKRANDGFTLVELIVVIAILAILAGIAVPAYSGYIKKANEAADLQLLGAVNTAFAAAVLENGRDVSDVATANLTAGPAAFSRAATNETGWSVGGAVVAFKSGKTPAGFDSAEFSEAFMRYFGNGNAKFKVIELKDLAWDPSTGGFGKMSDIAAKGGVVGYVYNGNAITVSAQAVTNMQNSTFGKEIGGEALLEEVAGLTNLVGSGDIDLESMITDEAYMRSIASYMGVKDADTRDFNTVVNEMNAKVDADKASNVMLNGLVYYAAEKTTQMNATDITSFLTSGNVAANLGDDQATKLANASMAYGMYTAFVNSDQYTGPATSTTSDPMAALRTISGSGDYSEAFTKYVKSAEGQADLNAYMSAMNVINDSTGNDATRDVLANGFEDPALIALFTQAIGK